MCDIARVTGWFYIITMVLFVLFFGGSLLLRGVWWALSVAGGSDRGAILGLPAAYDRPAHDPYFWASVALSVAWMALGMWTVADYFRAGSGIER